jgi:hypothetical protein
MSFLVVKGTSGIPSAYGGAALPSKRESHLNNLHLKVESKFSDVCFRDTQTLLP